MASQQPSTAVPPTAGPSATTPTRKQRERVERERRYLEIARRLLLQDGYLGLTMDRVAAETEYSKGTLYQHFRNKEELLVALSQRITDFKAELFERAVTFEGRPRERMMAIGMAYRLWASRYPDDIRVTQVLRARSLAAKVRPELQEKLEGSEETCRCAVVELVEAAVREGDLDLPDGMQPGQLAFGLWALSWGGWTLGLLDFDLEDLGIADVDAQVMHHSQALLDGHGWRPLTTEWDYDRTAQRIVTEVFPELGSGSTPTPDQDTAS